MVRRATSAMTASVVALVVMILFILSGFIAGLRTTVMHAAVSENWIVLSRGTNNEPGSFISREQYEIIKSRSQIETLPGNEALVSPEIITGFNPLPDAPLSKSIFTFVRGFYPIGYKVHRDMHIESGRWPAQGTAEMAVGSKLAARFPNLAIGSDFRFGRRIWKIVGVYSDGDSARESEVVADLSLLSQDIHVANGFEVLHVVLRPGMEDDFKKSLTTDSRLRVDTMSEQEFYARQTDFIDKLRTLGLAVAMILAVGSVFGAMNTMYSAVSRRANEIGVLRVLGFSRMNVLASFVLESVLLAAAGGILGEILGVIVTFATGLHSQLMDVGPLIFRFQLTTGAFISGLLAATVIGAAGGLLPAWRASRMAVTESLRAV